MRFVDINALIGKAVVATNLPYSRIYSPDGHVLIETVVSNAWARFPGLGATGLADFSDVVVGPQQPPRRPVTNCLRRLAFKKARQNFLQRDGSQVPNS